MSTAGLRRIFVHPHLSIQVDYTFPVVDVTNPMEHKLSAFEKMLNSNAFYRKPFPVTLFFNVMIISPVSRGSS